MKKLGVSIISCFIFFSCAGQRPENLGIHHNQLAGCPGKPNCVSSQAPDKDHFVAPMTYQNEKAAAMARLKSVINSFQRTQIVGETKNYLHVECRSAVMGFVDDLEFYFPKEKKIHLRSAARLGYFDFGVNRKRAEKIRTLFREKTTAP
ncbi:MAG: DUF1499 domain-containing protein [Desulfobacter sp.]|nr:DUF1499 domain-containing protein [Desulfobacter sp.]WDP83757.1 MAG: DUF1499 domain-containing protein [Desulfobacter sp.]